MLRDLGYIRPYLLQEREREEGQGYLRKRASESQSLAADDADNADAQDTDICVICVIRGQTSYNRHLKLTFAELSSTGPVRHHNEDSIGFWQPDSEDDRLVLGSIAAVADGVGGLSAGEIASRMAIDIALDLFKTATRGQKPNLLLEQIFKEANLNIYNFGLESEQRRMGTTLSACIFRNKEVSIGHVGDTRVYLVRGGQIKKLTSDHTYVEMQVKLGLISREDAMSSDLRSVLTRTMGQNPIVQVDFAKSTLNNRDAIVLCSDGLHGS